jgi:hypothetical protein
MRLHSFAVWLVVGVILAVSLSCSHSSVITGNQQSVSGPIEDVSSIAPKADALGQGAKAVPVQRLQRVESVGDCAPCYKTGGQGACINNQPCRGFGVKDQTGKSSAAVMERSAVVRKDNGVTTER